MNIRNAITLGVLILAIPAVAVDSFSREVRESAPISHAITTGAPSEAPLLLNSGSASEPAGNTIAQAGFGHGPVHPNLSWALLGSIAIALGVVAFRRRHQRAS